MRFEDGLKLYSPMVCCFTFLNKLVNKEYKRGKEIIVEDSSFYTATIIIQSITLVILVGTLIFFGLQWAGARREASLRMRPYLGFNEIAFSGQYFTHFSHLLQSFVAYGRA